jgi:CDP-glycerol glycerophosphotransferase (TagB/SpsB family)
MSDFSTLLRRAGATCICRWHPYVAAKAGVSTHGGFGRTEWEAVLVASPYSPYPQWVWLRLADMLITDFSSIAYDFLALGRPVVVVASQEEIEGYQRARGPVTGWENLLPGPLVTEDKELLKRVEEYLLTDAWQRAWATKYARIRDLFVGSDAGSATERVVDYVVGRREA